MARGQDALHEEAIAAAMEATTTHGKAAEQAAAETAALHQAAMESAAQVSRVLETFALCDNRKSLRD